MGGLLLAALAVALGTGAPPVDEGTFEIWMGKELAGREQFKVMATPTGFEIHSESIAQGGNTKLVAMRGVLRTNQQWQPTGGHFDASVGGRPTTIDLTGPPAGLRLLTRIKGEAPLMVRAPKRVDLLVVQNMLAHFLPLCAATEDHPRKLTAFPDAPVTVFQPVVQKFITRGADGSLAGGKLELSVVSVDFPDLRTELACKDKKVVAIRQGRYDVSAFRPGYESIGHSHW